MDQKGFRRGRILGTASFFTDGRAPYWKSAWMKPTFQAKKMPKYKLKSPAARRIARSTSNKCLEAKASGTLMSKLIAIIPLIEPTPKIRIVPTASSKEGIAPTTTNNTAAVPASPCMTPTTKGFPPSRTV